MALELGAGVRICIAMTTPIDPTTRRRQGKISIARGLVPTARTPGLKISGAQK
jgi:hypothetical protein